MCTSAVRTKLKGSPIGALANAEMRYIFLHTVVHSESGSESVSYLARYTHMCFLNQRDEGKWVCYDLLFIATRRFLSVASVGSVFNYWYVRSFINLKIMGLLSYRFTWPLNSTLESKPCQIWWVLFRKKIVAEICCILALVEKVIPY